MEVDWSSARTLKGGVPERIVRCAKKVRSSERALEAALAEASVLKRALGRIPEDEGVLEAVRALEEAAPRFQDLLRTAMIALSTRWAVSPRHDVVPPEGPTRA